MDITKLESTQVYPQPKGLSPEYESCPVCHKQLEETDEPDSFDGNCIECALELGDDETIRIARHWYDDCNKEIKKLSDQWCDLEETCKKLLSAEYMINKQIELCKEEIQMCADRLEVLQAHMDQVAVKQDKINGNICYYREKKLRLEDANYKKI